MLEYFARNRSQVLILIVVILIIHAGHAHAAENGKIAFVSQRGGSLEIYVMDADGSGQTRLTSNNSTDAYPEFSPDGRNIVFSSHRDHPIVSGGEIYVMKADGSDQRRLTFDNEVTYSPTWSPDASKIAFIRILDSGETVISVLKISDGQRTTIYRTPFTLESLDWAPTGSKLVFAELAGEYGVQIITVNSDGSDVRAIVNGDLFDYPFHPAWSFDGTRIMFGYSGLASYIPFAFTSSIVAVDAAGSNRQTIYSGISGTPTSSPDGTKIAFSNHDVVGPSVIYVVDTNGTGFTRLTNSNRDTDPSWGRVPQASRAAFDFDGDGRSDISVFRPRDTVWYVSRSTAGFSATRFGLPEDRITPADYDGDRSADIAVYRPSEGIWYVVNGANGTFSSFRFGLPEDLPVPGDFDGDGKADLSVFRPSTGIWHIRNSGDGSFKSVPFGLTDDRPVFVDFDGDGRTDISVFRPSDGTWYRINSSNGAVIAEPFGLSQDWPVPADYDGDGKIDIAVYRPSTGSWYIKNSLTSTVSTIQFGLETDIPAPGDYDGDSTADITVFRPSNGTWYRRNADGAFTAFQFGEAGDRPTPSAYSHF